MLCGVRSVVLSLDVDHRELSSVRWRVQQGFVTEAEQAWHGVERGRSVHFTPDLA